MATIKRIRYGQLQSEGFNNYRVEAEVEVTKGETPEEALDQVKAWVQTSLAHQLESYQALQESLKKYENAVERLNSVLSEIHKT